MTILTLMSEYKILEKCSLFRSLVKILSMSVHDVSVFLVGMLMRGRKKEIAEGQDMIA